MLSVVFRLPALAHLTAAALAFGGFQWVKSRLDASYAAIMSIFSGLAAANNPR